MRVGYVGLLGLAHINLALPHIWLRRIRRLVHNADIKYESMYNETLCRVFWIYIKVWNEIMV